LGAEVIGVLRRAVDNFLGRGEAAVTVPVMDGPLKPNQLLEAAGRVLTAPEIDNLAATAEGTLYTSGNTLVRHSRRRGRALSFRHNVPRGTPAARWRSASRTAASRSAAARMTAGASIR
jgi:hypothetical protein